MDKQPPTSVWPYSYKYVFFLEMIFACGNNQFLFVDCYFELCKCSNNYVYLNKIIIIIININNSHKLNDKK